MIRILEILEGFRRPSEVLFGVLEVSIEVAGAVGHQQGDLRLDRGGFREESGVLILEKVLPPGNLQSLGLIATAITRRVQPVMCTVDVVPDHPRKGPVQIVRTVVHVEPFLAKIEP